MSRRSDIVGDSRPSTGSTVTIPGPVRPVGGRNGPRRIDDTGDGDTAAQGPGNRCGYEHAPEVPCLVCRAGHCQVCGKPSIWQHRLGQWAHADGSDNAKCWRWTP